MRFRAGGGINPKSNYYVYIDDVSALQDGITISPITAQGGIQVYPNPVQDYLNVRFDGTISSILIFDNQGREVVVEDLNENLSRLDLTGLAHGDYVLKVTANDEIREINVTKK
ncbi:T9SS type A sorting domain-containing protein [Flavobacterium zepuense]|uniref:T9SS type A sorting domain-containing protein n=1 Tax=Flavobacterium zepuense TaxID=2593302 RepID=A0A552UZB8_9FLAO|nr:T9SS type A sorting domain-containing protein [Flavobacterium zepuense]TRW23555.1 T9SS type A sorting domain-containing protein [Flavobacterium zepuense]